MIWMRNLAAFTILVFLGFPPNASADEVAAPIALPIPAVATPTEATSSSRADRDSLREVRRNRKREDARLAGTAWSLSSPTQEKERTRTRKFRRPLAPYPPGVHWTDRPFIGLGTHIPRSGDTQFECEVVSYARSSRSALVRHSRWTGDTTGFGFPTFEEWSTRDRLRSESLNGLSHSWNWSLTSRLALALQSPGYIANSVRDLDSGAWSRNSSYSGLNGVQLKMRTSGSDTSATSQAIGVSFTRSGGYNFFDFSAVQVFPLGRATSGRLAATLETSSFESKPYLLDAGITRRVSPRWWSFAEYTAIRDIHDATTSVGLVSIGAARALGSRFMLDTGLRIGTTRQAADAQFFLGCSIRCGRSPRPPAPRAAMCYGAGICAL